MTNDEKQQVLRICSHLAFPNSAPGTGALKQRLEEEFGGSVIFTGTGGDFAAELRGVPLASLLEAAESGRLDDIVRPHGVARITEILRDRACFYQAVPSVTHAAEQVAIRSIGAQALKQELRSARVLVLTATDIEREAVHRAMSPWRGEGHILQGTYGPRVYYLGMLGGYPVAQTSSTMGSLGRQGATITALQAMREVDPVAVILIGIAFGMDRVKQRLGDVIVAESIFPYELQRVGATRVRRGTEMPCGLVLSNRFRELRSDWSLAGGTRDVRVHQGLMLSGEKLVDDEAFRDSLRAEFPTALGGEMEGAGAYAAAGETKIELILVKAICDWADGHKDDRAQPFAACAAVSLVKHVLGKVDVLEALGAEMPRRPATRGTTIDMADAWVEVRKLAPQLYETGPTERNVWRRSGGDLSRINVQGDGGTAWDSALQILERGGGGTTLGQLVAVMEKDFPENEALQVLARYLGVTR